MFFNLATLVLPLMFFGGITTATPLETREVKIAKVPGVDVSKLGTPTPIPPTIAPGSEHMDLEKGAGKSTSPNSVFHTLTGTTVDEFVVCSLRNCGNCIGYALSSIRPDVCYRAAESFVSFYIYRPSGAGLSYPFYVGLAGCSYPNYIPRVNECSYSPNPNGTPRNLESFYRK